MTGKTLRILFIASEAEPLVKVGGLGDVAGALPSALLDLPTEITEPYKLDIRLCIPFYSCIKTQNLDLKKIMEVKVKKAHGEETGAVYQTALGNLPLYLIRGRPISQSPTVYSLDTKLDGKKFAFFSLAVLEFIKHSEWKPDILHANDWHTALAIHTINQLRKKEKNFRKISTLITLHNLPFMGAGTEAALTEYDIHPSKDINLPVWARTLPLPMGLSAVDRIVTVSPNYARELLTAEFGCNLQSFFKINNKKLQGIINGLDTKIWDPKTDACISYPFDYSNLENKNKNKADLQKTLKLPHDDNCPLMVSISRMDQQKGVDIILDGLRRVKKLPWQAVVLGSGDPKLEKATQVVAKEFPHRFLGINKYDPVLSHQLYAAADIYMMPSRYEPCGLSQLIAMNYGCIPVARNTGGLHDTIRQTYSSRPGTGFLFQKADPESFANHVEIALAAYAQKPFWLKIQKNAMEQDFSWKISAQAYFETYRSLFEKGAQNNVT
jgi:starch synthase